MATFFKPCFRRTIPAGLVLQFTRIPELAEEIGRLANGICQLADATLLFIWLVLLQDFEDAKENGTVPKIEPFNHDRVLLYLRAMLLVDPASADWMITSSRNWEEILRLFEVSSRTFVLGWIFVIFSRCPTHFFRQAAHEAL